jgi:polar amino acid transport system substrate-binding protein
MSNFKLGFVFAAALLAGVGVASAQQQVIKVGYPPFGAPLAGLPNATTTNYKTLDPKGAMAQGAMIDLMNAVAKDAGIQIQYVGSTVGDQPADVAAHTIDMVVNANIGSASANAALYDIGMPIYSNGDVLIVKKSDTKQYKTWDDLKGLVAGVLKNTAEDGPTQSSGNFKEVKVYGDGDALNKAVSTGEVQAGISSSAIASSYQLNPATGTPANLALGIQVVPSYQMRFPVMTGLGVVKGNAQLLAKLNASVAKLKADGTIKAIFTKYGLANVLVN